MALPAVSEASREILEFTAVRNCLAHRRRIVDQKFIDASGDAKRLKLGEHAMVTYADAESYLYASCQYVVTAVSWVADRTGATETRTAELAAGLLERFEMPVSERRGSCKRGLRKRRGPDRVMQVEPIGPA